MTLASSDRALTANTIQRFGLASRIRAPFTYDAAEFSGARTGDGAGYTIGASDTRRRRIELVTSILVFGVVTRTIVRRRRVVC